jgi:hypothetical protein
MPTLLRVPKYLLEELQRDCSLARCPTRHSRYLVFHLGRSNLVYPQPAKVGNTPKRLDGALES